MLFLVIQELTLLGGEGWHMTYLQMCCIPRVVPGMVFRAGLVYYCVFVQCSKPWGTLFGWILGTTIISVITNSRVLLKMSFARFVMTSSQMAPTWQFGGE